MLLLHCSLLSTLKVIILNAILTEQAAEDRKSHKDQLNKAMGFIDHLLKEREK